MIGGIRIITDINMVEDGQPYEVRRTWRERLFTLPWRPMKATRVVVPRVPTREILRLSDGTMVMHPVMLEELKSSINRQSQGNRNDT